MSSQLAQQGKKREQRGPRLKILMQKKGSYLKKKMNRRKKYLIRSV